MSGERRVYLTPEEAASGTTRMIRPAGGDWVEIAIPPTRHDALLRLPAGSREVRVRVTVVRPGLADPDSIDPSGLSWRQHTVRIGLVLLVVLVVLVVAAVIRHA